jgi:ABC-type amino acid transport substrate-binding protein
LPAVAVVYRVTARVERNQEGGGPVSKRRLAALGTVAALLLLSCAQEDEPGGQASPTGPAETTPAPTVTTIEEGVLTVGSCLDFPPFESLKGGDEVGFDVDLAEAIGERLGLTVEWVQADFDTIFTALAGGQFDMVAAAVTATGDTGEERAQVIDFSDFYFNSRQSLAVNVQETPDIQSTADLGEGHVVGVQKGTTGADWAKENLEPQGVQLRTYNTITPAFADLEAGTIVGIINDEPASAGTIAEQELEGTIEIVEPIDTNEKYAFPVSKDNPELRDAVNGALAEIIEDGTYATIFEQYFPGAEVPPEFQPAA